MLAGSIGDESLALLRHLVLLRYAAHARKGAMLLLVAVDEIVVRTIAHGDVSTPHLRHLAVSAPLQQGAFLRAERPVGLPGIHVNPAGLVRDRHPEIGR